MRVACYPKSRRRTAAIFTNLAPETRIRGRAAQKSPGSPFRMWQAAKTGTGGHLPGCKVTEKIAEVRGIKPEPLPSPRLRSRTCLRGRFPALRGSGAEVSGGVPIGFKISANRLEQTIDFALEASADYIILDGRGGGTGAAPAISRQHFRSPHPRARTCEASPRPGWGRKECHPDHHRRVCGRLQIRKSPRDRSGRHRPRERIDPSGRTASEPESAIRTNAPPESPLRIPS